MVGRSIPTLIQHSAESYGATFQAHLFEQYKLYVDSADRISERRVSANNYLLTVNAFLVTLYGLMASTRFSSLWPIVIPVAGFLVALTWHRIIASYRDLNSVKFEVIHELEHLMPAALYGYEWHKAEEGRGKAYHPLSHLENWVPCIFMVIYLVLVIFSIADFMC